MRRTKKVLLAFGVSTTIFSSCAVLADDSLERALSFVTENRYSEARRALDPVLGREPLHPRARLLHGFLRVHEGRRNEAVAIFKGLLRDHPDMFETYNNLAVLYAKEDRLDDARINLLTALELQPDPTVFANLGDIYVRLARRAYARAGELDANEGVHRKQNGRSGAIALRQKNPSDSSADTPGSGRSQASVMKIDGSGSTLAEAAEPVSSDAAPAVSLVFAKSPPFAASPDGTVREPAAVRAPKAADKSEWLHIASYKDHANLTVSWRTLSSRHEDLLSPYGSRVSEVDLGRDKGVFFRLYVGPLPSRDTARKLCVALRARDVYCDPDHAI